MANRMTIDELKSYLWDSAVLLRTNIDAGAYKQYIFPLLFFKRICDVYDEETKAAEQEYGEDIGMYPEEELHTFLVPKGHHWKDVRQVTEDVGAAIVKAFREIERVNGDRVDLDPVSEDGKGDRGGEADPRSLPLGQTDRQERHRVEAVL